MSERHWATITVSSRNLLAELRQQDFELLRSTVRSLGPERWSVDALLSREQIEQLTGQGHRVFVKRAMVETLARTTQDIQVNIASLDDIPSDGYLSVAAIEQAIDLLVEKYPSLCQIDKLPHATHEQRKSRYLRVGSKSGGGPKPAWLLLGGAHARELVNPDLLLFFVHSLCKAYTTGEDLVLGAQRYDAASIQRLLNEMELLVFPLVNPDGRAYVLNGNTMWRKNRNPNPGMFCEGVDINRNFGFLWSSGIGTSDNSCSDVFRGTEAFSEPETQNVRHLIQDNPQLQCVVDVHSYSELIMYPWGDDDSQDHQEDMNFHNPAYDGKRGVLGDTAYREYLSKEDLEWYLRVGRQVQTGIEAVRGRVYTLGPSADLYPTTGTAGDYPYAHGIESGRDKPLYSLTIETGREFQPPLDEARQIILEVSSGLAAMGLALLSSS
ncbi:MAG: hypothetical protein EP343_26015 [Deltaproteobacteria bacterium]|nr:MAG: hypothetical protein EP343_26015 [Deltaproteobacteria bacterium]